MNSSTSTAQIREIDTIVKAPPAHWVGDGFFVHGYFNSDPQLVEKLSPFLLLDYGAPRDFPATTNMRRGVGPHPHRGFETVTVAFEGSVAHHDRTGGGGVIGPGDVQWMTAGAGILHKEYREAEFARAGGRLHMAQIWVNIPAKDKMAEPGYQLLESTAIRSVTLPNDGGIVRVIAGKYADVAGAARTFTPIDMLDVHMNSNGRLELDIPAVRNLSVLVMQGEISINGQHTANVRDFVIFGHNASELTIESRSPDAHILILSGEPIAEPVAQYGPFVMNTRDEIRQAITDFNAGRFGELAD